MGREAGRGAETYPIFGCRHLSAPTPSPRPGHVSVRGDHILRRLALLNGDGALDHFIFISNA